MNRPPEPPPEGVLIEQARRDARLSVREAARRAGISEGWWRQVVKGYQPTGEGGYILRHAPAGTVAQMAAVVKLTPERMETEGQRPDAAEIIRQQGDSRIAAPVTLPRPSGAVPPAPERSSLFGDLPPGMAAEVEPHLRVIEGRAEAAAAAHPGVPLQGRWVFPADPEEARRWDVIAASGVAVYPDRGFESREIALALAIAWWQAARQEPGTAASGLTALPGRA